MEEYANTGLSYKWHHCYRMSVVLTDEIRKHEIQLEHDLLVFSNCVNYTIESIEEDRTAKLNEEVTRFIANHTTSDFQYYATRILQTNNQSDKLRYQLICWFFEKKIHFLISSIYMLIEAAKKRFSQESPSESIALLVNAFNLANLFGILKSNPEIAMDICNLSNRCLREQSDSIEPVNLKRPFLLCLKLEKNISHLNASEFITILHNGANRSLNKNNLSMQQQLLELSLQVVRYLSLTDIEKLSLKKIVHESIADSLIKEGNALLSHEKGLGACLFYKNAIEQFKKTGNNEKIQEMYSRIEEVSPTGWKIIESEVTIPDLKLVGDNEYELIKNICLQRFMIPDIQQTRKNAKDTLNEHPLLQAFSHVRFNKKGPTSHPFTDVESIYDSEAKTSKVEHILLGDSFLAASVRKLENKHKISAATTIQFVKDYGILSENSLALVSKGIEMHFQQDYISSIHILIPQIEATLRFVLESKGFNTLKEKAEILMENELGGLLNKQQVKEILGENLCDYLNLKYVDNEAINLRNEVSHALLELDQFNHTNSFSIIHTIMMLLASK